MQIAMLLTTFGAGLSILAGLKIWEVYHNRKPIVASYLITGDPATGDKIAIHNLSGTAVMLEHWELLWVTKRFFLRGKTVPIDIFDNGDSHLNLAANSIQPLNLNGQYHFNWNPEIENNVRLFIKLRIAGRKRFLTKLVSPKNYQLLYGKNLKSLEN